MSPMPLPVRVAAGLMAIAVEQARKLPDQLAELPVTAASRVVQAGMRVQQRVTELAIKGDEVFSLFRRVEDTPSWARFDEDDEAQEAPPHQNGSGTSGSADRHGDDVPPGVVVPGPGAGYRTDEIDESDVARKMAPHRPGSDVADPRGGVPGAGPDTPAPRDPGATTPARSAPAALPSYEDLSLAQLRGKLRGLSLAELEALLEHEHAHQDRAPFVTMLSNRIVTVRSR